MLPRDRNDRKLFGPVLCVTYEFVVFEERDGEPIEIRDHLAGYELFDREGRILEEVSADRNLIDQVYKDAFVYDEEGKVAQHIELDENDRAEGKSIFEYAENGNIIESHYYSMNGGDKFTLDSGNFYTSENNSPHT